MVCKSNCSCKCPVFTKCYYAIKTLLHSKTPAGTLDNFDYLSQFLVLLQYFYQLLIEGTYSNCSSQKLFIVLRSWLVVYYKIYILLFNFLPSTTNLVIVVDRFDFLLLVCFPVYSCFSDFYVTVSIFR